MNLTLPVVTVAAILDSINPCAISVLLLTIGFLLSLKKTRRQIIFIAGIYILGIFLTYIFIGLGILRALIFFGISKAISHFGALILILTATLSLLEQLIPNFPIHLAIPAFSKPGIARLMQKASVAGAIGLGVIVGLFEFPCTGGPYLLILTLLHDWGTRVSGILYLIYYNLIFISPLIVILILASNPKLTNRIQVWRKNNTRRFDIISSLLMIALGVIIFVI